MGSGPRAGGRACVLVVAAGAAWESRALSVLEARPGVVVLRRCMDVTDLLAGATSGQAQAAVVSADAPGLDAAAVDHLRRYGVGTVVVLPEPARDGTGEHLARLGVAATVPAGSLDALPGAVLAVAADDPGEEPTRTGPAAGRGTGRAVAVWGPAGAPGRTTVTLGLAGELARRGLDPLVLDVDPWGGAVAQHLGVLDEVSGLLACARFAPHGDLAGRYLGLQRRVAGLRVLTGLPRADRWVEVRSGTVAQLVELARRQGPVLLDTGFSLEEDAAADYAGRPGRNAMTLDAVDEADAVVVVGAADPVGLTRLAHGLVDLRERSAGRPVHVVVNRMRASLGWSEQDVAAMVGGFAPVASLHFLPDDRPAADRALLAGRTLAEGGDSPLARALGPVLDAVAPETAGAARGVRRRRAGRALRR